MKQYHIKPQEKKFSWGTENVLYLGEEGRGRHYELVNVVPGLHPQDNVDIAYSRRGKPKIVRGFNLLYGWLAHINTAGVYTRGTYGYVSKPKGSEVRVIAVGSGAYGMAGRIGSWKDYLLNIPDNTLIRVKPVGGSKRPAYYLYFDEDIVLTIPNEELELFLESRNIEMPEWEEL